MSENTHILFDNDKVIVSPNLIGIFEFIIEIENEIRTMLEFVEKQENIRIQAMEIFDFVIFLGEKLKENKIDFNYSLKSDPLKFADNFGLHPPTRSQFIVIFAFIETIFTLHSAYKYEISDEDGIRNTIMNQENYRIFINEFLLSKNNDFYFENTRFKSITAKQIRKLRNSLTHFFSVSGGLSINPIELNEKCRKVEKHIKNNLKEDIFFISPKELFELISSGNRLLLKKWSKDFETDCDSFKRKISFVKNIVNQFGAKLLKGGNINI